MNCELCGSNIRGEVQVVNIDGGMFRVCNSCSKLGTAARVPKPATRPARVMNGPGFSSAQTFSRNYQKTRTSTPPPSPSSPFYQEDEMILRDDYSKVIKSAREVLGITQDELGMKINEKPSVISHLETGSMKPSDALARKLEHFLKVQLFVPVEDEISTDSS
ncbi:MAG: multiprotein bridging factor aMBF1 [Thaumarchaeota archaeon]|nr:multiprotein bridging factor aMBF1 [Nitrososphaerota archaeon]